MKICAVVLGDYINGYAIIRELSEEGVKKITVLTYNKKLGYFSNKVSDKIEIKQTKDSLLTGLNSLRNRYDKLILFPTDDWYVEQLTLLEDEIKDFCFIPFNTKNSEACSDKVVQYQFCQKADVPYPKSKSLEQAEDLDKVRDLKFPVIMKPVVRNDLSFDVFRSKRFNSLNELIGFGEEYRRYIDNGVKFLLSEIIPGVSHGNIYAYSAYVSKEGEILNEWVGRKLSQYPDDYGVFSSASNEAPRQIWEQGRKLIKEMNLYGFCEPEFKYDYRDDQYKLMEVNLRSMMWNEVGARSGVKLHYTQWCYANNLTIPTYVQNQNTKVVLFYFKHEFLNLFFQKGYRVIFKSIWGNKKLVWAGCYKGDYRPIFNNLKLTLRTFIKELLKK